jgi:hypothetical protein
MQSLIDRNQKLHSDDEYMYLRKNIGVRDDWSTYEYHCRDSKVG